MQIQKIAQLDGHRGSIYKLVPLADPSGAGLVSIGGDGWVVRWDLANLPDGTLLAKADGSLFSAGLVAARDWLVVGNGTGNLYWLDLAKNSIFKNFEAHTDGVFAVAAHGDSVYSLGGDGKIARWLLDPAPRLAESLHLTQSRLRAWAVDSVRGLAYVGGSDGAIYTLDLQNFALLDVRAQAHTSSVFCLWLLPDGRLGSGGRDAHFRLWNPRDWSEPLVETPAHWWAINDLAWSPDGRFLATASRDKTIRIWDGHSLQPLRTIRLPEFAAHTHSVNSLYWSAYRQWLVSAGDDRKLCVWQVGE